MQVACSPHDDYTGLALKEVLSLVYFELCYVNFNIIYNVAKAGYLIKNETLFRKSLSVKTLLTVR